MGETERREQVAVQVSGGSTSAQSLREGPAWQAQGRVTRPVSKGLLRGDTLGNQVAEVTRKQIPEDLESHLRVMGAVRV